MGDRYIPIYQVLPCLVIPPLYTMNNNNNNEHFQSLDSFEKSSYVLGSEAWEEYSSGLLTLIKDFVLSVWEERKVRLYGEHANVHQSHSQNDSGNLRGVAGGDGELGCLCGKAGTSHLCDGSAHSSGCVVNGSNAMAAV